MRRSTDMDENAGTTGAAFQHPEQQTSSEHPSPAGEELKRQAPTSRWPNATWTCSAAVTSRISFSPITTRTGRTLQSWMARRIYGRLSDVWPELDGADNERRRDRRDHGRNRRTRSQVGQHAPATRRLDRGRRPFAARPTASPKHCVETSPGKHHYVYVCRDLDWRSSMAFSSCSLTSTARTREPA